jgi:hypothetical protein
MSPLDHIKGSSEWRDVDYAVKQLRFKIAGRRIVTTNQQYDDEVAKLVATTDFSEAEIRTAVREQLQGQYPKGEFARNRTEALDSALAFVA